MEAVNFLYVNWCHCWQAILDVVEPNLPDHLHWNEICWKFVFYLAEVRLWIHQNTRGMEHWEIVTMTMTYCFYAFILFEIFKWIFNFIGACEDGVIEASKNFVFRTVRKLPIIGPKIRAEIEKSKDSLREGLFDVKGHAYVRELPQKGASMENIVNEVRKYKGLVESEWSEGLCSGTVYYANDQLTDLMTKVYTEHVWSNPLHADVFPDVRKMEAEVVSMCTQLFKGGPKACGMMSSGGSESILLALKAYREIGRERGIEHCEVVAAVSAHPAFDKAAFYMNMKLVHVPVDAKTGKADVKAMKKAITKRTVALVGSCPSFPHGSVDDITQIAKLALNYKLGMHVDCCLGGFIVPFMRKAGFEIAPFDFSVPGVTSISADTHKYGFAPKGSSVVMFSDTDIRKHTFFVQPNWPGGVYASPSIPGSRPGNVIATTWASLLYHGEQGFIETTKEVVKTTKYLAREFSRIPGIRVLGEAEVCVVAFTSDVFNIFLLSNDLCEKKWKLSPLQFPSGLHLSVTMLHTYAGVADRLIADVRTAAKKLSLTPDLKCEGQGAIYGMSQQIPDRSIINEICETYLDEYYSTAKKV